jgi:hypothetical protein
MRFILERKDKLVGFDSVFAIDKTGSDKLLAMQKYLLLCYDVQLNGVEV